MEILLSRFYIIFVLILFKYNYKNTPETINSAITKTYPCQTRVSTKDARQWAKPEKEHLDPFSEWVKSNPEARCWTLIVNMLIIWQTQQYSAIWKDTCVI